MAAGLRLASVLFTFTTCTVGMQARVLAWMEPAGPSRGPVAPRLPRRRIDHNVDPSRPHEKQYRLRDERVLLRTLYLPDRGVCQLLRLPSGGVWVRVPIKTVCPCLSVTFGITAKFRQVLRVIIPSLLTNYIYMAFAAPDEHEKLLVEVERLRADKEDMVRRIRERDVRSTEFATKLDAAEKKANKAAEDMAAERSKRYKLDQQLQDANESIDQQRKELRSLIARLEKSTTAHSMALEQLTESQKELAISRAAASRLDSTCEILRTEREAAQQEAAELLKALAVTDARAAAAKQASVSMMEQMGRERGELSTQRDLAQERLEATQAKLEQERVHRAREEVQIQAGIAADRAEWRAMSEYAQRV